MKKLARFALVITLLVSYFPPSRSAAVPAPASVSLERWLNGAAGYARAVELQKELNVPLIVYFYTDWCGYCRVLDNQYLPAAPVQDYLRGVVKVRINPEHGQAERALANRYGVNGYPSFFVMRNSATRFVNVHPFRRGVANLTPAEFAKACRVVAPISQKLAADPSSGTSGKFRERPEVLTKVTTTKGGGMMVTVVPPAATSRKAAGKKP